MKRRITLLIAFAVSALAGCPEKKQPPVPLEDAGRSPNATLRPAPRSSVSPATVLPRDAGYDGPVGIPADSKGRLVRPDAQAPSPQPMVPGKALARDRAPHRELQGVTLTAEWEWEGIPSSPGAAEVSQAGVKAARSATRHLWQVEILETGRMRVVVDSPAFPLTKFTELRARDDRFGHILVWPNTESYRIVPPGALRALLDERRMDVSPVVVGRVGPDRAGRPRFGFPTRTNTVSTPWAKVELEQARTVNVGSGGALLCRLLLELASVRPDTSVCEEDKVPVRAHFDWKDGSGIVFNVDSLLIRSDFPSSLFTVPPPNASFTDEGLPPNASGIFLTREEMMAFRSRGIEIPQPRTDPAAAGAPGEGLLAVNHTDALRFLLLDGVPVAWVPAHGRQYVIGTRPGRYNLQWRSFLGTHVGESKEVLVPARVAIGEPPDAGAALPGAAGAPSE